MFVCNVRKIAVFILASIMLDASIFRQGTGCIWCNMCHRQYGGEFLVQRALSVDVTILAGNLLCSGGIYIHTAYVSCVVSGTTLKTLLAAYEFTL